MTCAGKKVVLIPDTPYAREVLLDLYSNINSGYRDVKSLERTAYIPWDKEYERIRTNTYCDAMGNFEFDQLSDGDYFIITSIIWPGPFELEGGGFWNGYQFPVANQSALSCHDKAVIAPTRSKGVHNMDAILRCQIKKSPVWGFYSLKKSSQFFVATQPPCFFI